MSDTNYNFLRFLVPYAVMFLLFVLNTISFAAPLYTTIEMPFVLMVLYYWAIYRPTLIPPFLVFICGICLDALSGWPIGISSFVLLLVRQTVIDQRVFLTGQPFTVVWLGFVIVSVGALFLQWTLFSILHLELMSYLSVVLMVVAGGLVFPAVALVLNISHRVLPLLRDQYSAVK